MEQLSQLRKILDITDFQRIQDELALGVNIAMLTVDFAGTQQTRHSLCSEFCAQVRLSPEGAALCRKCDARGGIEAARQKVPYMYICHMGLVDIAIPIIVDGVYLGAILGGQIRPRGACDFEHIVSETSPITPDLQAMMDKLPCISQQRIIEITRMIHFVCDYVIKEARFRMDHKEALELAASSTYIADKNPLTPALDYIEQYYHKPLTLTYLAKLCGISSTYFCKQFKKQRNINFAQYINQKRVDEGKRLLEYTKNTITSIAYELGYEDCGYFIKVFKKYTDMTPQAYRDSVTKPQESE